MTIYFAVSAFTSKPVPLTSDYKSFRVFPYSMYASTQYINIIGIN
jgi:hypothetical protein